MNLQIDLLTHDDKAISFTVENKEEIQKIRLYIIFGDEIIDVFYKDGTKETFDSNLNNYREEVDERGISGFDGEYLIYDKENNIDLLNDKKFLQRRNSYDLLMN